MSLYLRALLKLYNKKQLHQYGENIYSPNGHKYIRQFDCESVPTITYRVGGVILTKEKVFISHENRILIKYTLVEAKILDTLLYHAVTVAQTMPRSFVILFIYLLVLVMNFFIPSGSAKAFLLMPLIVPVAQIFDISAQLCVMAFAFGDGFSNVMYPTNPVLLISLGMAGISYVKWFKWTFKIQFTILVATSFLLLFGLVIGYN